MPLDRNDTRPLCAVYVAWHPLHEPGGDVAKALYQHFRRDLFTNVAGGVGLSVLYRSAPVTDRPSPVPFDDSHIAVVFLLLSREMTIDAAWRTYIGDLLTELEEHGLTSRVIPVCMDGYGLSMVGPINAVRYDAWPERGGMRNVRLISGLTHELSRVLRTYIASIQHPGETVEQLQTYLEKVCVFLSHSKHDAYGEAIALAIKEFLSNNSALSQFFDVRDIPAGLSFPAVLERYVQQSAIVAIHTDSYSSREWCRREIIEAKKYDRPLVVADCIHDIDERSFPYLGNVPIVRMEPEALERIPYVVARLLDEVFKDYLWKARLSHDGRRSDVNIRFVPRTPELIALSNVAFDAESAPPTIVYPDPPLGVEERQLFYDVRPDLTLMSYSEYAAANGGAP